jgi:hypothetical protein
MARAEVFEPLQPHFHNNKLSQGVCIMASNSLPDCILKQNLFLQLFSFLAEIKSFLIVIFSSPLRALMKCGSKITKAFQQKGQCILRLRAA